MARQCVGGWIPSCKLFINSIPCPVPCLLLVAGVSWCFPGWQFSDLMHVWVVGLPALLPHMLFYGKTEVGSANEPQVMPLTSISSSLFPVLLDVIFSLYISPRCVSDAGQVWERDRAEHDGKTLLLGTLPFWSLWAVYRGKLLWSW